jgi:homocysteine S-methyltransferase
MTLYRDHLPQMEGEFFLTDAGMETDIMFNRGIEIREFAAHTLLPEQAGRKALQTYYEGFLALAHEHGAGFIVDAPTWKAHRHRADDLGETPQDLHESNEAAVGFMAQLRENTQGALPIVLNALIGPRGDAYAPEELIDADAARDHFREQIGWLAGTEVDMVTAMTFKQATEAQGFVEAAEEAAIPSVISFALESDDELSTGQTLSDAIAKVDTNTGGGPAYYMIHCAHPDHFQDQLGEGKWRNRICGVRANASRRSHAELDEASDLDPGNTDKLASQYGDLIRATSWLNIFGACCGGDLRHVSAIADRVSHTRPYQY